MPTFDDKAPNGWWGTWAAKAEDSDLHRDIAKEKADSGKYADAWKRGGGGVWTTPAYDKDLNTIFVSRRQPLAGPRWQHPPGRQPLHRRDRCHRRHQRQDQVVLPDGSPRRMGPRRHVAAGGPDAGWQEGRGPRRQDRRGSTSSMRPPASWSARARTSCRRKTCSRCRPTRAPGCCRAPTAARSGHRSRSTRALKYAFVAGSAPADELHHPYRTVREGQALAGLGLRGHSRAKSSTASSPPSTSGPARSPGRTRCPSP